MSLPPNIVTVADAVAYFTARDEAREARLQALEGGVTPAPTPVSITGTPPTTGTVGQPYSFTPTTANGSGAKVFALTGGTLLAGLTFDTSTGAISGTPTAAGTMSGLVVRVTDTTGSASTVATNVTIAAAAATMPQPSAMIARWRTADIPAQANGSTVTTWTDSIGGMSATTTGTGPTYRTAVYNGKPALRFSGQQLTVANLAGSTLNNLIKQNAGTIMIVMGAITGNRTFGCTLSSNGGFGQLLLSAKTSEIGDREDNRQLALDGQPQGFTTYVVGKSNGEYMYVNGSPYIQQRAGRQFGDDLAIGGLSNNFGDGFFDGDILEIIVWSSTLSTVEVLTAEKAVRDYYGQTYPWASIDRYHAFHGDSITAGQGANSAMATYPAAIAAQKGWKPGTWGNFGRGGERYAAGGGRVGLLDYAKAQIDPLPGLLGKPVDLCFFEWYNEATASGSADTTIANSRSYLTERAKVANLRVSFGTSTDFSNPDSAGMRDIRAAYDAYWDTAGNRTGLMAAYIPIHTDTSIGVAGAAAADGNSTYFIDGIHLRDAGYTKLAAAFSASAALS